MRDERTRPSRMVPLKADSSSRMRFCCTASNSAICVLQYALRSCSVTSTPVGKQKKSIGKDGACMWVRQRNSGGRSQPVGHGPVCERSSISGRLACLCVRVRVCFSVCVGTMNEIVISLSCARRAYAQSVACQSH